MAVNSFVIDSEQLQQAKEYAIATCRESEEYYSRMNTILSSLYEALLGIDGAMAEGWNVNIQTMEGNLDRIKYDIKEQSGQALNISQMIQAAIDQAEISNAVLENEMNGLQFTMPGLAAIATAFDPQIAAAGGQGLSTTKSVAVSGAALTGAFALMQPDLFTDLQQTLQRFVKQMMNVVLEISEQILNIGKYTTADCLRDLGASAEDIRAADAAGPDAVDALVLESIQKRNKQFMKDVDHTASYYAGKSCVRLTYDKLKYYMTDGEDPLYNNGYTSSGNGKEVFGRLADTSDRTDLAFTQTKYAGEDCLNQLISDAGDPATGIIVSFPKTKSDGTLFGHVVYIDAIVNGKVYVTDTYSPDGKGAASVRVYDSVDAFKDNYENWHNGAPIGAVHFRKTQ